ncbi:uncharacterized protein [Ambystoma mexicanum]|uniref:uncharacterized protein n=1 Tax=Ambystoma mexicanum TaxID=8296 RepID=UPI0037E7FE08
MGRQRLGVGAGQTVPVITIDRIPKVEQSWKRICDTSESKLRRSVPGFSSGIAPPVCSLASLNPSILTPAPQEANHLVVSPFKQSRGPQKRHWHPAGQDPAQDLKADLLQQLEVLRKELVEEPSVPRELRSGRLLKARLKPLHPVRVRGPTVEDCQGMLPERLHNKPIQEGLRSLHKPPMRNPTFDHHFPRTPETLHHTSLSSLMEEQP